MRPRSLCFAALIFLRFSLASDAELPIPPDCRQAVCVTAPGWNTSSGTLQRWQRADGQAPWQKVGPAAPVILGANGLGWGIGLHRVPEDGAPRKVEGDRRAPAGMFALPSAFGRGPHAVGALPWQPITPTLEAVDDPQSRYYNRIVDRARIERPDWHSSERMAEISVYALGIVVAHNPRNVPGAGSCIFVHLQQAGHRGTAGCTALREADLFALARWLDPARKPVLIQLPRAVAERELAGF